MRKPLSKPGSPKGGRSSIERTRISPLIVCSFMRQPLPKRIRIGLSDDKLELPGRSDLVYRVGPHDLPAVPACIEDFAT